jgi:hypothetical protein
MKPSSAVEQTMAVVGSVFREPIGSYWSGLLGATNLLEISPGRAQEETQWAGPLVVSSQISSLVGMIQTPQAIIAAPSSLNSASDFLQGGVEIDITLTAPPRQYGKASVQLRRVGQDAPRIFYDPDHD